MTYRDDHDAALARADALEAELKQARAEITQDENRIARLEAELARRPKPHSKKREPKRQPEPREPREPRKRSVVPLVFAALAGILVIAGLVFYLIGRHRADRAQVADGWDVQHYLELATADARSTWSDVEIARIDADYVDSSGRAQLTVSGAELRFYFRSPSHAPPPPAPVRLGLPAPSTSGQCELRERIYKQDTSLTQDNMTESADTCAAIVRGPLRCTVLQIWQRAIAKGAQSSAVAAVRLRTEDGIRLWRFEINGTGKLMKFPDDCTP